MSRILDGLDTDQMAAVTAPAGTVRVSAGPGSGKTRVLTRRIAYRCSEGTADAQHVLALTFSRQAAQELRQRLFGLRVGSETTAGTFHSLALAQLSKHARDNDRKPPELVTNREKLLRSICTPEQSSVLQSLGNEIDWMQARCLDPDLYQSEAEIAGRNPLCSFEEVASVAQKYTIEKRHRRLVDFDDLLVRWTDLLATDSTFAAAQRWRYRHLFVDEMQDLTPRQFKLITTLLNGRDDLFIVGDPDQSIYSFAGAAPELDITGTYPMTVSMTLRYNYRCSPEIVAAANSLASEHRESAAPAGSEIKRFKLDSKPQLLVETLQTLRANGFAWNEMAILARSNAKVTRARQILDSDGIPNNGVHLGTFHSSKGLEWPVVVLFDCQSYGEDPEEKRLVYVAMTRASRDLTILNSRTPTTREDWLEDIAFLGPQTVDSKIEPWRRELQRSKQSLGADNGELLRAILEWRNEVAQSARVLPESVLSSERARKIAEKTPSNIEAIASLANWGPALAKRLGAPLLEVITQREISSTTGV